MQHILCFFLLFQPLQEKMAKVDSLNHYSFSKRYTDVPRSFRAAEEAEKLSIGINYSEGLGSALANQVILHAKRNEDTLALKKFAAIDSDIPVKHPKGIHGYLLMAAGKSNFNIGLESKAKEYYQEAVTYFREMNDPGRLVDALNDLGSQLARRGHFTDGLSYFRQAYTLAIQHDLDQLPSIYRYMANVYNKLGDQDQAMIFSRKNLQHELTQKDPLKIGDGYHSLAGIYAYTGRNDSAKFYYYKSLEHYQAANNDLGKTYAHANLAAVFNALMLPDSAIAHLNAGKESLKRSGAFKRLGTYLNFELAKIYQSQENYGQAEAMLREVIKTAQVIREMEMLRDAYLLLSEVQESNHAYDSALYYFRLQKLHSDSLINASTERRYANLRVRLETIEKDNEIVALNQQLQMSQLRITFIVIVLFLLFFLLFIGWKYYDTRNRRNKLALENSELLRRGISQKLELRERELADFTLNMIQKNRFLEELEEVIKNCKKKLNGEAPGAFSQLLKAITINRSTEKDWNDFKKYFGNVHKEFFDKIKETYPSLTPGDLRHCALLKMNLSLKESAEILGVDPNSIKMARYRMKRKMGLAEEDNLGEVVAKV